MNYALNQPNKEAFIEAVTDGLLAPPPYFGFNVAMNKMGYDNFEKVKERAMNPLSPSALEAMANATNALILDTRNSDLFKDGFIPQSINIGIKGDFAPWVGALIGDVKQEILLVTDPGMEEEVITRLSRVGFDHVLGYLAGGFDAWKSDGKPVDTISRISAIEFEQQFELGKSTVIDVRKETEYAAEHIEDAYSRPLATINEWFNNLDGNHFFLHCAGGYRSMIAASILQARGVRNFTEIAGGYNAIAQTNMPTTDFICQSKVL